MFSHQRYISSVFQLLLTNWNVWSQLNHPIDHPVFKRVQRQLRQQQTTLPVIAIMLISGMVCFFVTALMYTAVGPVIIMLAPLGLMIFSSSYTLIWMYKASSLIAEHATNNILDLLGVIPAGGLFVRLTICRAILHDRESLHWINLLRQLMVSIVLFPVLVSFLFVMTQLDSVDIRAVIGMLVDVLMLSCLIYVEHVQSIVMGSLIAMILPGILTSRIDAPGGSILVFLVLQVFSYVVPISVAIFVEGGGQLEPMKIFSTDLLPYLSLTLFLFVATREILVIILWRINAYRYNERAQLWIDTLV